MSELHGIIFAYNEAPALRELVERRTAASLPFCGRYRLIDFPLSSMQNAGIRDVGIIMQRDYQSLLDHLGGGKEWDMARKRGGLRMLPPFGSSAGAYEGAMEALISVEGYIRSIKQEYVVLTRGNLAANVDIAAAFRAHRDSGAEVTAVCTRSDPMQPHQRFVTDANGRVTELLYRQSGGGEGYASLEMYIMPRDTLIRMLERCSGSMKYRLHRDALAGFLAESGNMSVYVHEGYARHIFSVEEYFCASMDMLRADCRASLFPPERPVRTKGRSDVSTYYSDAALSRNSLVADGCFIEGSVENCVVFRGVRIGAGAVVRNSVIMQDTIIGEGAELSYVIADKDVEVSAFITLAGSPKLPLVLPKLSKI